MPDNDLQLPDDRVFKRRLFGISVSLFLTYLTVAIPLPVLNLYVINHLNLNNVLGGLSVGISFLATILTRAQAGKYADLHGGKRTFGWGILGYFIACLICAASAFPGLSIYLAYGLLILGRILAGIGESFTVVGIINWGLSMSGPKRSGRVMGWVGMGMYGAYIIGSPVGIELEQHFGFVGVMLTSAVMPLIGLLVAKSCPQDKPLPHKEQPSIFQVLPQVWMLGLVVCLQGIGFAAISAFVAGDFISNHWNLVGWGLSAFGVGFVLSRILFTHLPDKIGGFPVACGSLLVEAIGQYLLWASPVQWLALIGTLLTGLGCSMVFPSMGVEVVKRVSSHLKGTAMGCFTSFQDLAYGLTGPLLGLFVGGLGYSFAFLVGGVAATIGLIMALMSNNKVKQQAESRS